MPFMFSYLRCSHLESAASGLGLESQLSAVKTWAAFKNSMGLLSLPWGPIGFEGGITLDAHGQPIKDRETGRRKQRNVDRSDGVFVDFAVSAFKKPLTSRPAGRMLDAALSKGDHVVFAKFDRGFRSQLDWAVMFNRWTKRGITIHFVDPDADCSTASGRMIIGVHAVMAEYSSALTGERQCEAAVRTRARGGDKGGPAMGFKPDGRGGFKPDEAERETMVNIVAIRQKNGPDRAPVSWALVSDEIEEVMAMNENRSPKPRVAFQPWQRRQWSPKRCRLAYRRAYELNIAQGEAWAK